MEQENMPIPGWGVDRDPHSRPGYPLDQEHHVAFDTVQGQAPYTVTVPLKGLSGAIRRAAYKAPDWKPRRWMMLLIADRVDALESRLTARNLLVAGGVGGLAAAVLLRKRLK